MSMELLPFDPAEFLTDDESQAEYLTLAFENSDPAEILRALAVIARARRRVGKMTSETDIDRELARSTQGDYDPSLGNVLKIMQTLRIKLSASNVA